MEEKKGILSAGEILAYAFGLAGVQVMIGYMNSYQAQYYKSLKGELINLSVVAIILFAAKLISAFADPFIGRMIDRSHFKGGKLKPFILAGAFIFSAVTFIIFSALPSSGIPMYAYIFITFLIWSISMTLLDIPTQGMLSIMSPEASDRNNAAGVANLIKGAGQLLCFVVVPVVCILLKTGDNPMGQKEYSVSAVFMIALSFVLILFMYFKTKERVPFQSNTVSTREMFHMVKDNKPLMLIFLSCILGFGRTMSSAIQVQAAATLMGTVKITDSIVISGENAGLIMGLGGALSAAISGAIMPFVNKRWGEKKTFFVFAIYGFVTALASFIIYAMGFTSPVVLIISLFVCGFMYGPHTFLPLVMLPDCIDYYELKTGKRTDGICFSVLSLATKISAAMCVAVGLLMVGISGYTPGSEITASMRNIIYAAYILIPGICCITAMIPMFSYKLVGEEKKRVARELAEKRKASQKV